MSCAITCPYCFRIMQDDEVLFRSEKVNHGIILCRAVELLPEGLIDRVLPLGEEGPVPVAVENRLFVRSIIPRGKILDIIVFVRQEVALCGRRPRRRASSSRR